jgi:DsbC/DsbD-like thiol-disulfide interchange protein
MRVCYTLAAVLALTGMMIEVADAQFPRPEELVQTSLVADVTAIEPGKPFRLALVLTIKPGWHIYWTNPGEGGEPTRVEWTLPEGFTASPTEYPTPKRFEQEGPIVSYGYENSVWLMVNVTAPERLAPGKFEFAAKVDWLACEKVCIPGSERVRLRLPMGRPLASDAVPLFEEWTAKLPVSSENLPDEIESLRVVSTPKHDGGSLIVETKWRGSVPGNVVLFPPALRDAPWKELPSSTTGLTMRHSATVRPLTGQKLPAGEHHAILSFEDNTGRTKGVTVTFRIAD